MLHPNDRDSRRRLGLATKAQIRAFWNEWILLWERIGVAYRAYELAADEYERWKVTWSFDQRGRRITHPNNIELTAWDIHWLI